MIKLVCEYKDLEIIEVVQLLGNRTYHVRGAVYTFKDVDNAKAYIDSVREEEQKMRNIELLKEIIKEEVAKLEILFPQKEEWETEEGYMSECMDVLHDVRDNFDWDGIMQAKNELTNDDYDDFIYEELWEQLLSLLDK